MSEVRYVATILIDVWVEDTGDDAKNQERAEEIAEEFASLRTNARVVEVDIWQNIVSKLKSALKIGGKE